jgi:hypothetical protein
LIALAPIPKRGKTGDRASRPPFCLGPRVGAQVASQQSLILRPVLRRLNISVSEAEVLAVTLPNRPGAVADDCERLTAAHINVSYMYCTSVANGRNTNVVLKVPDSKKAMKVLENGKSTRRDMKIKLRRPAAANRR